MTATPAHDQWKAEREPLQAEVDKQPALSPEWVAAMKKLIAHDLFEPSWLLEQIRKEKK